MLGMCSLGRAGYFY